MGHIIWTTSYGLNAIPVVLRRTVYPWELIQEPKVLSLKFSEVRFLAIKR